MRALLTTEDEWPLRTTALIQMKVIAALFALWPSLAAASTPVPTYGTYFGGTGDTNVGVAVAVDPSAGNVIIAGYTTSLTLPGTANAFQPTRATGYPDNKDVFVAKFDPTGHTLLWATFLGGDDLDEPTALAVDSAGSIYVVGATRSSTFPVTPGAYLGSNAAGANGFAAKISADGHSLLFSTYLPGTPNAVAVTGGGAYIGGSFSPGVVTAGALGFDDADPGALVGDGVYLLHLNSTGTGLVFGAYLGGGGFNPGAVTSVALSPQGDIYVAGFTADSNIPTTANALQAQYSNPGGGVPCCSNGFIVEVDPTGSQLLYGTYVGPQYYGTAISCLAVAPDGSLYFSGTTNTTTQATPGAYLSTPNAPFGGFVAKLTLGRSGLDSFSYIPSDPGSPEELQLPQLPVLVTVGNQPETVYVAFPPDGGDSSSFGVVELGVPTLSLLSSFRSDSVALGLSGSALAAPHSLWLVGPYVQPAPESSNGAAALIQLTDVTSSQGSAQCQVTGDGTVNALDVQAIVNEALGVAPPINDLNQDGVVNVVDVQIVVNAALGLGCAAM